MFGSLTLIEFHIGGLQHQPAALSHGISGILDQIHNHLFHATRIGLYRLQGGFQLQGQLDVLADQPAEHLLHSRDDLIEVQDLGLQHLAAPKGQQLLS